MIVIDIECVGIDNVSQFYDPPRPDGRLTDPVKIEADIAKKTAEREAEAALFPWTTRVIAISTCEGGDMVKAVLINSESSEVVALKELWASVWDQRTGDVTPLVTFNGLRYDLPVLLARSRLLGVSAPDLNLDRYRSPHPDLMQLLSFRGAIEFRSLKFFARRFGLDASDAFSGREIAQLYSAGDWDSIRKHVESDVTLTRQLGERVGLLKALVRA